MTVPFVLGGPITSGLWHFCGYGLVSILEDAGFGGLKLYWRDGREPRLCIQGVNAAEVGTAVLRHAKSIGDDHWIMQSVVQGSRSGKGLFSPRVPIAKVVDEWKPYLRQREEALDQVSTRLDRSMLAGLGQPAHWHHGERDNQPDRGASRWEMKVRARGEEFVTHRLRPMVSLIAARSATKLSEALQGRLVLDEGREKNKTGGGFAPPGIVDTVVGWCALWGMSWFPTVQRSDVISQTACTYPRRRTHPDVAALPIVDVPLTAAAWKQVLISRDFDQAAFLGPEDPLRSGALTRLRSRGVIGLTRFPFVVEGGNAPDRYLLEGAVELFGDLP